MPRASLEDEQVAESAGGAERIAERGMGVETPSKGKGEGGGGFAGWGGWVGVEGGGKGGQREGERDGNERVTEEGRKEQQWVGEGRSAERASWNETGGRASRE